MKNIAVKRLINTAITFIFLLAAEFLGSLATVLIWNWISPDRGVLFGTIYLTVLVLWDMICALPAAFLAYLITAKVIAKETVSVKQGALGALVCAVVAYGLCQLVSFIGSFVTSLLGHPMVSNALTGRAVSCLFQILGAFLCSMICIRAPKPAPVYAPYAPYGAPQPPYGQPPYGAPQQAPEVPSGSGPQDA